MTLQVIIKLFMKSNCLEKWVSVLYHNNESNNWLENKNFIQTTMLQLLTMPYVHKSVKKSLNYTFIVIFLTVWITPYANKLNIPAPKNQLKLDECSKELRFQFFIWEIIE